MEACRRQGIDPIELVKKTIGDLNEMYADAGLDNQGFKMLAERYEEKREDKVRLCLKVLKDYFFVV